MGIDNNLQVELHFTEVYKENQHQPAAIREALCLRAQYPAVFEPVRSGDWFAGRKEYRAVGFSPQVAVGLGYFRNASQLEEIGTQEAAGLLAFWEQEQTAEKVRQAYSPELKKLFPYDDLFNKEPGVAFPLYRMGGANLDFGKLAQLGVPGMKEEIRENIRKVQATGGETSLYEGMLICLDLLVDSCEYYAVELQGMTEQEFDPREQERMISMIRVLKAIQDNRPSTLREAIQLIWLYSLLADIRNYGRMDVYLGDFLNQDLDSGRLNEAEGQMLLCSFWQLIADRVTTWDSRVIIGGVGRRNPENADRFAMMALEATRLVKEIEPQLSLRCYEGMDSRLFDKGLQVLSEGRTYPILYNDEVNVPSVQEAFGVSREEAEQYVPYGCGEYVLEHRSYGTPSGVINLLKALEITLHNGVDPISGERMGLALGNAEDFRTFEELLEAYKKQVDFFVAAMAEQEALEYKIAGENSPYLYLSMLYDSCVERNKGIFSGGIKYLGGTLESYGNMNTADSLTAIKTMVYDRQSWTLPQLVQMLDADFQGYDAERIQLLNCAKYGNDDHLADSMAEEVHKHVCLSARSQSSRVGLASYLVVVINNSANTDMGGWTAASADGRKSREPMGNGNAPVGGRDKNGITAALNSMSKLTPSIHAGAVHNLKFSPDLFKGGATIVRTLLDTYFQKGGTQAMITVVNRNELEQAMVEPEKYSHIFVRVGGFSARFVELKREVQLEILSRTLHG
ncbi:pyruvate formate lyase family protein [Paenibacillus wynnii]|uniref:Pyruvate formate-lyase n=1 Tax=Paenibacillus wynnii TaxID=268407 RepID=A0A098M885_9BACL|nr:pyruvate formate lyase family protein [Paenibacillus wynnii]KGE18750.1 hypothetical protein PWYN_04725 [Paenibacillus wynnii]